MHLGGQFYALSPIVCILLALKVLYSEMDKNQPDVPLLIFMNVSRNLTLLTRVLSSS